MKDTIGDIDILAVAPESIMETFRAQPYVAEVIAAGDKKTSVRTTSGIQVDLRVVPAESWGAAMQYFTGSKEHNVAHSGDGGKKGWKLSEYGLFEGERVIASESEEDIYAALGMQFVPPPMREDGGEVRAALRGELPVLVELPDLRGDLHTHTDLTDGIASLEDMVAAGHARGYSYYAVTDHAPDLAMQRMTLDKALEQRQQVAELQRAYPDMRLLHGTELNIAPDGSVDWPGGDPARLRRVCRLGPLAFRHVPRGDDPPLHRRLREPVRGHHRPPHHPQDRQAPAGGRRLGRRLPRGRPHRARRWRSTPTRTARTCPPTWCGWPSTMG